MKREMITGTRIKRRKERERKGVIRGKRTEE